MGVVGACFALATTAVCAIAAVRGSASVKLYMWLTLGAWIFSNTYGAVTPLPDRIFPYAVVDATCASLVIITLIGYRSGQRILLLLIMLFQLHLHLFEAAFSDFGRTARWYYILTLNISYSGQLLTLLWIAFTDNKPRPVDRLYIRRNNTKIRYWFSGAPEISVAAARKF
jgi:hypothetical protein